MPNQGIPPRSDHRIGSVGLSFTEVKGRCGFLIATGSNVSTSVIIDMGKAHGKVLTRNDAASLTGAEAGKAE
jgi:hypothetical protein